MVYSMSTQLWRSPRLLLNFPLVALAFSSATPKKLFPYQREGVKRLVEGKRMLLADEMGLGKTVQCIAAINELKLHDPKILIVCPKSVLGVWEDELQEWLTTEPLDIRVTTTQDFKVPIGGSITLINYDICHKLKDQLQSIHYDILICDEAHYLKSTTSKRTLAVLGKGTKRNNKGIQADYLWLLTGTPVLNRPVELFPLLQALEPDKVESFEEYAERYCQPKAIQLSHTVVMNYSGASNLVELAKRLEPRMIRRYKSDVLMQLPPKFRSCVCLTGSEDAKKQEQLMLKSMMENDGLKKDPKLEDFSAEATSLIKYLGAKTSMDLENPNNRNRIMGMITTIRKETAMRKLAPALELLEDVLLSKKKIVVFCHHRELITRLVQSFGNRAVSIIGGMDRESRVDAVRRFQQDDNVQIFVGSIHAAGVGITLTAASHVIFLELDWSPAVMSQAEDRCHRVGQTDSVQVQYYVFKDTIDEWLAKSILSKQSNINQIIPEAVSTQTGYVFDFGKHNGMRFEDVPHWYLEYLVKNEVWRARPYLWKALFHKGMVSELPPLALSTTKGNTEQSSMEVDFVFDFGKHKGLQWGATPSEYREWVLRQEIWKDRSNLYHALFAAGLVGKHVEVSENKLKESGESNFEQQLPNVPF